MQLVFVGFLFIALAMIVESRTVHRHTRQIASESESNRIWWPENDDNGNGNRGTTTRRTTRTTPTAPVMNQAAFQRCMKRCLTTPEYNPLCGTNRQTYSNIGQLTCAQSCGQDVQLLFRGTCTPLA